MGSVSAATLLLTACDRERNMGSPTTSAERTTGQKMDDRQLSSKVKGALDDNNAYKFPDVKVNTFDGKLQLSGFVATREQKQQAEEIAKTLAGSGNVENKITVRP